MSKVDDLRRRHARLEKAMETCTDGDEYVRCAARLDELAAEIERAEPKCADCSQNWSMGRTCPTCGTVAF